MSLVDRFGRKGLLLTSTLGAGLCVFALGAFFYIDENKCPKNMPPVECNEGFSNELLDSIKWIPVVSTTYLFRKNLLQVFKYPFSRLQ